MVRAIDTAAFTPLPRPKQRQLAPVSPTFRCPFDRCRQLLQVHRLLEHVGRTALHGAHRHADVGKAREQNDADLGVIGQQGVHGHGAIGVRQPKVEQHDIGRMFGCQSATFRGGGRTAHRVAERLEELDQRLPNRVLVVDHEQRQRHDNTGAGSETVSVVPCSGRLSMPMAPPCSSMMR